MTDYFALFNEPRRPWLNLDELKTKFLSFSSEVHPDRFHAVGESQKQGLNQRCIELNAAYNCLREPKGRLRHLLELERGAKPVNVQPIPFERISRFMAMGELCREVDLFLREKSSITSPLLKAQAFERGLDWIEKLKASQHKLNEERETLTSELISLDEAWSSAPDVGAPGREEALPLARLEQLYQLLSYTNRWSDQIQERLLELSF